MNTQSYLNWHMLPRPARERENQFDIKSTPGNFESEVHI